MKIRTSATAKRHIVVSCSIHLVLQFMAVLPFGATWVRYQPYGLSFLDYVAFTDLTGRMTEMKATSRHEDWKAYYRAALFEPDKRKLPCASPMPRERLRPGHGNSPTQGTTTRWSEVN